MSSKGVVKHHGKGKHPVKRKSHRVSGMHLPKVNITHTLQTGVGLIAGTMIATTMQKYVTMLSPKIVSGVQLLGGIMYTGNKNPFVQGAAWGVASAGAIGLGHEFGVLRGVDDMVAGLFDGGRGGGRDREEIMYLNGLDNGEVIAGLGNDAVIAGQQEGAYADAM